MSDIKSQHVLYCMCGLLIIQEQPIINVPLPFYPYLPLAEETDYDRIYEPFHRNPGTQEGGELN